MDELITFPPEPNYVCSIAIARNLTNAAAARAGFRRGDT
jgi:hypothetical protein